MFLGTCTGISSSMANSLKFSAIFLLPGAELVPRASRPMGAQVTSSQGSKYEHRRASALLRNIQNIRISMGKKPIVSVTYKGKPLYRGKTVYIKTHKTAINRPVDHTGET